jgi:hypothetical protein
VWASLAAVLDPRVRLPVRQEMPSCTSPDLSMLPIASKTNSESANQCLSSLPAWKFSPHRHVCGKALLFVKKKKKKK